MGDFDKLTTDGINIKEKIADILKDAEGNNDLFAYTDSYSFKGRNYKIRTNFNRYPEYLAIEIIQEI